MDYSSNRGVCVISTQDNVFCSTPNAKMLRFLNENIILVGVKFISNQNLREMSLCERKPDDV